MCGIVPASDTGAFEMAMWTMLGARGVDALAWESFGKGWVTDTAKQLKIKDLRVIEAEYGRLPDLAKVDFDRDVLFTWNGTTSGVRVPNGDWIAAKRGGLTFADATSAVFAQPIDWTKVDVATYSWQKALGGEAAHGMLILSPRAIERLESYTPPWPLPKIFRLTKGGKLIKEVFEGETINTPSMLCVEDYLDTLQWAESIGGLKALFARADANARVLLDWAERTPWVENLAADPATRSNTSVCLKIADPAVARLPADGQRAFVKQLEVDPGQGECRARHRRPSRRAAFAAHLVRLDGGGSRYRRAHALARLGLRRGQGRPRQGGVTPAPRRRGTTQPQCTTTSGMDPRLRGDDASKGRTPWPPAFSSPTSSRPPPSPCSRSAGSPPT